jgi:spore maturation protein CgeB
VRVLLVEAGPHFSVADVGTGWAEGLQSIGCQVATFNLADRLGFYSSAVRQATDGELVRMVDEAGACRLASKGIQASCFEWWPAVVVIVSCFYIPLDIIDVIRSRGIKVVILHTESPYEDDRQLERAARVDLNVLNDPTNLDRFAAVAPTTYLGHAYRPTVHRPGPANPALASDFAFVGTGYESRIRFLESVEWTGIDVALGGNWQQLAEESSLRKFVAHDLEHCVENTEAVDLYRSAKASANLYRREAERPELAEGWAMGPREVELAATGTFFLREPRGEGDDVLSMVPTFEGSEDFEAQLRWYLAHDDERQAVADQARAAIAGHTFAASAAHLLRLLDELNERTT